jgi:ATP-dependent Clp protease ATP-binding subunit ClpA
MIFMTSNLGASEMGAILRPNLGFAASDIERRAALGEADEDLYAKISRAGVEAARRKFTPEFMNRIDKVVVFRSLGAEELGRILSIELNFLQQRIFNSAGAAPFVFNLTSEARGYLLLEGTDMKYGARHLKRAIERALVHPLSNLIASGQVHGGDLLKVDFDPEQCELVFIKEAEDMPAYAMVQMIEAMPSSSAAAVAASAAPVEQPRAANAKSQRTR